MKKLLIAAIVATFFVSCGNTKDKYVDKLKEATEDIQNAKSPEEIAKIGKDLEEYTNGVKDEIEKIKSEDESAKKEIEAAEEALSKAALSKSNEVAGGVGEE